MKKRCPRCDSPDPKLHPAVQYEGEVQICTHSFHGAMNGIALDRVQPAPHIQHGSSWSYYP